MIVPSHLSDRQCWLIDTADTYPRDIATALKCSHEAAMLLWAVASLTATPTAQVVVTYPARSGHPSVRLPQPEPHKGRPVQRMLERVLYQEPPAPKYQPAHAWHLGDDDPRHRVIEYAGGPRVYLLDGNPALTVDIHTGRVLYRKGGETLNPSLERIALQGGAA